MLTAKQFRVIRVRLDSLIHGFNTCAEIGVVPHIDGFVSNLRDDCDVQISESTLRHYVTVEWSRIVADATLGHDTQPCARRARILELRSMFGEIYRAADTNTISDLYLRFVGHDPFTDEPGGTMDDLDDVKMTLSDYIKEIAVSEGIHWSLVVN